MGGLLSSLREDQNQHEPQRPARRDYAQSHYYGERSSIYSANPVTVGSSRPVLQPSPQWNINVPQRTQSPILLPSILKIEETRSWKRSNVNIKDCRIVELDSNDREFMQIRNLFKGSTKRWFQVVKIQSVQNPFLMAMYCLRKDEMECLLGGSIEEELLFHGTSTEKVNKICTENFNWRLHGKSIGNRFGQGVSFSKVSYYASHYSSKNDVQKKMIVAKVIIGRCCIGHGDMVIPDAGCDTSIKIGGKDVFVKYQDYEFYPAYIITYTNIKPRRESIDQIPFDYDY